MIIELSPAKHQDERWGVAIDMTARLDAANNERVELIEGSARKIIAPLKRIVYTAETNPLEQAGLWLKDAEGERVIKTPARAYKNVALVVDKIVGEREDSVWDAGETTISPDGTKFHVVLQSGEPGATYELDLNVRTNKGFIHKVQLVWNVSE